MFVRWLRAALLIVALSSSATLVRGDELSPEVSDGWFASGGALVHVEWVHPVLSGRRPAVLLLYGVGGSADVPALRATARKLAVAGLNAFIVNYFDRTEPVHADRARGDTAGRGLFVTWMATVEDAVGWVSARKGVDSTRLALYGISLGASLALSEAAHDGRIRAVVDYYGMLPEPMMRHAGTMPPVLILHGDADTIIPVDSARRLGAYVATHGAHAESHIYPGQEHGFYGAAEADAEKRVRKFLRRELRQP